VAFRQRSSAAMSCALRESFAVNAALITLSLFGVAVQVKALLGLPLLLVQAVVGLGLEPVADQRHRRWHQEPQQGDGGGHLTMFSPLGEGGPFSVKGVPLWLVGPGLGLRRRHPDAGVGVSRASDGGAPLRGLALLSVSTTGAAVSSCHDVLTVVAGWCCDEVP
jgi:hypothetical protein